MSGCASSAWPQRPFNPQWLTHSHPPNYQPCPHNLLYDNLSHPPQFPYHLHPYSVPPSPAYPASPHLPRPRTFSWSSCNQSSPRHMFPTHQLASGCVTSQQHGFQYAEPRPGNQYMLPSSVCANILGAELEEPQAPWPNGALLSEKVGRQEGPNHIRHQDLLEMFHNIYGKMLKSVEIMVDHWLRDRVSCKATVRRFSDRKGWQACDSKLLIEGENFFCAPYIVVTFAKLPHRTTIKELFELIRTHCLPYGEHMQPAFKFTDRQFSLKFEPGTVYLTVDAEHLTARTVTRKSDHSGIGRQGGQRGKRHRTKEIEYYNEEKAGENTEVSMNNGPKELRYIDKYTRNSPKRCKETVKRLTAKHFGFDAEVWAQIEQVEFRYNGWYPLGSADQSFGLTITSKEVVQHDSSRNADSTKKQRNSRHKIIHREKSDRELHDIAPTLSISFPVKRQQPAEDKDASSEPLLKFVEELRRELSAISAPYGQFAFLIFWDDDKVKADWFGPNVVYNPTGDGDTYMASTVGCAP
ncbi:hypothetical protein GGS21DRAFT_336627 [Xylaria nigripes]|nr:hypothetical protein GGS21DRAFT_336627 [Xylaria nigripes]